MDNLFVLGILVLLGYWCFRKGKHLGSVKGYHVGRRRGRRRQNR